MRLRLATFGLRRELQRRDVRLGRERRPAQRHRRTNAMIVLTLIDRFGNESVGVYRGTRER
jgi:hypothetical protein